MAVEAQGTNTQLKGNYFTVCKKVKAATRKPKAKVGAGSREIVNLGWVRHPRTSRLLVYCLHS